jgi:hypothetical protein
MPVRSSMQQSNDRQPSDASKPLCPNCGEIGRPVGIVTLKHMVMPEFLDLVNKRGFAFCRTDDCPVVYFHADGETLKKGDLRVRVGLKETADPVPVCYCFGFTERMLVEEVQTSGRSTIRQRIAAEMKADNCACEIRNPQGSCCLGNVKAAVTRAERIASETTHPVHH